MTPDYRDIPLSLYIHIPWCERKCPYCDFNSHQAKSTIDERSYIDALLHDLDCDIAEFGQAVSERKIRTIFIGGGTPSLFSGSSFQYLFTELRQRLEITPNAEITLEANPGSSEADKFNAFRDAGINRLSIGVQSFSSSHLKALGRVHSANEALQAAGFAKTAGFDNFNLDLMFGLPDQNIEQACEDLQQAIELSPTHLSVYQLTIEPNTLFHYSPPVTPDNDALWDMQEQLQHHLTQNQYEQYEVSAYGQTDHECRHNLNYWHFGDYLGIGAGAHGKLTLGDGIYRRWKTKHPTSYMQQEIKVGGHNLLKPSQLPFEYMLNTLRLNAGFSLLEFEQRTGQPIAVIQELLDKHKALNLITLESDHVTPTRFGHNMLNNMLEDYLGEPLI